MDLRLPIGLLAALACSFAPAGPASPFSGVWSIDLRPAEQAGATADCGLASLALQQKGRHIQGTFERAGADCAPLEAGATVSGEASGAGATLEIRSSRNGTVVRGRAVVKGDKLYWQARNIVVRGEPEGDESILRRGILSRSDARGGTASPRAFQSVGLKPAVSTEAGSPRP